MECGEIKTGDAGVKRTRRINHVSTKGRRRRALEKKLDLYLMIVRAEGLCEICGREPDWRGLSGAHIEPRNYTGSNDTAGNKLCACGRCHDHSRYAKGLCITQEEAKKLVALLNEEHGIDPGMTGADVLRRA